MPLAPPILRGVRSRRGWRVVAAALLTATIAAGLLLHAAGYLDRNPVHIFPARGRPAAIGAVYFSGDIGLRHALGAATIAALTQHGIPVVGISTPALFRRHRSGADVDRIVANAIRIGLARTGQARVVVIGQSLGADALQTGLAALPAPLRARVAAIVLVVPGEAVFFRADPTSLTYFGTPDAIGLETAPRLDWAPLTCLYGRDESESLCPALHAPGQRAVALPGGHLLNRDYPAVVAQVLAAIARAAPAAPLPPKGFVP